jgi:hypothetical protein
MITPPTRPPRLVDDGYYVEPEPLGPTSARDRWARAGERPISLGCVHVAIGIFAGIWLAALLLVGSSIVDAAPSSGQTTDRIDVSPASSAALSGAPHVRGAVDPGNGSHAGFSLEDSLARFPRPGSAPQPTGEIGTALYSASATWCAPTPTQCQSWGGDAQLGAVFGFRWGDEPYRVRVWRGDRSVDVLVVSHCACGGTHNAIDLSPAAFRVLAPLSRGRVDVAVEDLRGMPGVTLPPTDR